MSVNKKLPIHVLLASSVIALAACQANGGNSGSNAGDSGGGGLGIGAVSGNDGIDDEGNVVGNDGDADTNSSSDTGFPNDPPSEASQTVDGTLVEQGDDGIDVAVAYGDSGKLFYCGTSGANATAESVNGLVGGVVGPVLDTLGGSSVTALTNSIQDLPFAADQDLVTASTFTLTASALEAIGSFLPIGGTVDTLEQIFYYNAPQGDYAVAAVTFPIGTVEVGVASSLTVNTYLDEFVDGERVESSEPTEPAVVQDLSAVIPFLGLDLLGQASLGPGPLFVGRKVTTPYNRIVVSISGDALAVNVGEAMYLHEVCVNGSLVDVPAQ